MLKAKLQAPGIHQYTIGREKLKPKFDHAALCKLTLVTAPAGYGKTTAVLGWLGKCGLPYAWLSLDSQDNDPVTFWQYICASLEGIASGIALDADYVFASQELMKANIHIDILIDRLSEVSYDFLLVLDDLHLISAPSILSGLSHLLDYLPVKMHLVFISRTLPELEFSKHRIKWQVQRLEEEELRFGEEEILRFYQARGISLRFDELKAVESYTEGWVAALVAVTLSMEDGSGHTVLAALSRSSRDIGQYLRQEVIRAWRPEKLSFAMKTSILDTLWPQLCDAVTDGESGLSLLEEMAEGNAFMTELAGQRQVYRYHQLFKSLLRELLEETSLEEIPRLYRKAGLWFQEQGLLPESIEYFLNGGAFEQAFELIEHQIDHIIHKNDFARLLSWIERLPGRYRDNSFKSASIYALYYAETGRYDLSRQWIDRMKALADSYPYAPNIAWSSYSRTACLMAEANLLLREGDLGFIALVFAAAETDGGKYFKIPEYNDLNTADIYFYRCPANKLASLLRDDPGQYRRFAESYRRMITKNPGYAPLAVGEYLYESNRLEEALPYLLKALEEAKEAGCPGVLVPVMVNITRLKRSGGDISGAFAVLEECEKQLQSIGKTHWQYLLDAFRCRLYLDIGNMEKAQEWLCAGKLTIFTELNKVREFELLTYARVLIVLNRTQDAQILLQRLLAFTGDAKRLHSRVEVLNMLAMLSFRDHRTRLALRYMDESLGIGLNEGYARSYLDELVPMAQMLRSYIKSRASQPQEPLVKERKAFAARMLTQMRDSLMQTSQAHEEVATGMAEKIWEQFTAQEKKVLELMVKAATNKEISDKLGISIRTVKTHTGNIYGKLGLKNRVQCVQLVRELGIL